MSIYYRSLIELVALGICVMQSIQTALKVVIILTLPQRKKLRSESTQLGSGRVTKFRVWALSPQLHWLLWPIWMAGLSYDQIAWLVSISPSKIQAMQWRRNKSHCDLRWRESTSPQNKGLGAQTWATLLPSFCQAPDILLSGTHCQASGRVFITKILESWTLPQEDPIGKRSCQPGDCSKSLSLNEMG